MAPMNTAPLELWCDDVDVVRNWRQPKRMSVSQWADDNRILEPLFASEPGPWRTDRCPYAREWMDSAALPWVRRVTLMASTQVGKSEALNNVAGYYVNQKPSPTMFVLPNRDAARLAAERRVLPMVQSCETLLDELTERAHDVKHREIVFKRSVLYMRSAQSPTDLASVPVRLVLCDEVDKWPRWSGREADPLALVAERTRTFHDHCIVISSTPTTRDGTVWREYEQGDMRKYHLPCPHCEAMQVLEWSQVKWHSDKVRTASDMREQREAWYECKHCKARINDIDKRDMLRRGVWVPDGKTVEEWQSGGADADRHEHRSYHIWAAYSPWLTFWKLAVAFLESKDDPARLQNFTNSWLAEVFEERVEATSDDAVAACISEYEEHTVPDAALVITAAVDVQLDYMVYMVCAWGMDEQCWVIATARVETWEQLRAEVYKPWGAKEIWPRCVAIDSRYRRDEVMEFARRNTGTRMIAGVERNSPVPFSTTRIDKHPKTGQVLPNSLTVWTVNVGMFKDLASHRLRLKLRPQENPIGLTHLPSDMPQHFVQQLSAEHKTARRSGNRVVRRWVLKPGRKRNEAWDVFVYNIAAARMVRVDTLRSSNAEAQQQNRQRPKHQRRIMGRSSSGVNMPRQQW